MRGLVISTLLAALAAVAGSFLYSRFQLIGAYGLRDGTIPALHSNRCEIIPELEACEDAWVSHEDGLALLACSSQTMRHNWVPAVLHLNAAKVPSHSTDYIAVLDLETRQSRRLRVTGVNDKWPGIFSHGIDAYRAPGSDALEVFLISHRPPQDRLSAAATGADSVIEHVRLSSLREGNTLEHVQTIKHELVRTPNNLVAVDKNKFYVSNDHRRKSHWTRKWEVLLSEPSDIVYCDVGGAEPSCKVAAEGVPYPNGITKGPGNIIYQASTVGATVSAWEIQADHTLALQDVIKIGSLVDNIHCSPNGEVFAATLPILEKFVQAWQMPRGVESGIPFQSFRISNETGDQQYYGQKYKVELAFSDPSGRTRGATTSAPYKNKLLVAGLYMPATYLCTL